MQWLPEPRTRAVRALYWRDEILQLVFWLHGEGLGERLDPDLLGRFLGMHRQAGLGCLQALAEDGLLRRDRDGAYRLTEQGRGHRARVYANEPAELTQPAPGTCGPECWCHISPDEAAACEAGQRNP